MDAVNPYLALSYPLFEVSLWFNEKDHSTREVHLLQQQVHARFEIFEHACQSQNLSIEDTQSVKYALTTFIDESALTSQKSDVRHTWQSAPLQLEYFGEHTAGEGFFNKLILLKQQANADVLEVYFLCLQLGFKGIYGIGQLEKLTSISLDLRAQLDSLRKEIKPTLSIDPIPEEGFFQALSKAVPFWVFSSVFVCFIFVFYFSFSLAMDGRIEQSNKRLNAYYEAHVKANLNQKVLN